MRPLARRQRPPIGLAGGTRRRPERSKQKSVREHGFHAARDSQGPAPETRDARGSEIYPPLPVLWSPSRSDSLAQNAVEVRASDIVGRGADPRGTRHPAGARRPAEDDRIRDTRWSLSRTGITCLRVPQCGSRLTFGEAPAARHERDRRSRQLRSDFPAVRPKEGHWNRRADARRRANEVPRLAGSGQEEKCCQAVAERSTVLSFRESSSELMIEPLAPFVRSAHAAHGACVPRQTPRPRRFPRWRGPARCEIDVVNGAETCIRGGACTRSRRRDCLVAPLAPAAWGEVSVVGLMSPAGGRRLGGPRCVSGYWMSTLLPGPPSRRS